MKQSVRKSRAWYRERPWINQTLAWAVYALLFVALAKPVVAAGLGQDYIGPLLNTQGVNAGLLDPKRPVLGPEKPPPLKEVLLDVCRDRGYGEACAKALLGMARRESVFDCTAVGDHGLAQGCFQIHIKTHRVSLSCAQDWRCSANWTISYMESNGYPKYPRYAIQCHNGCGIANGYAASVTRLGERLWNEMEPAPKQAATQTVALK
ncbi:MAG: hypothetical protein PHT12_01630 [Patescibacteria group bacterium]|nr:hypothetical protein [Patescibacteria group bacterium]